MAIVDEPQLPVPGTLRGVGAGAASGSAGAAGLAAHRLAAAAACLGGGVVGGCGARRVGLRRSAVLRGGGDRLPGLDQPVLEALFDGSRDVVAAYGRGARLLFEQRPPRDRADHAVDGEPGTGLIGAHRGVGLGTENAVSRHPERALHVRDEVARAAELQRQAALSNLDRTVGG
jgi:hypothetical protein